MRAIDSPNDPSMNLYEDTLQKYKQLDGIDGTERHEDGVPPYDKPICCSDFSVMFHR